jgi:hypothetical protein
MIVVAGPPGSGKTRYFPVTAFGVDAFNIDDRCAQILGSYRAIPRDVRRAVAKECERFVLDHIERRESFAVETTLRATAAIDQAELARKNGFATEMHFVARIRLPRTSHACFSARRRAATLRPSGRSARSIKRASRTCERRWRPSSAFASTTRPRDGRRPDSSRSLAAVGSCFRERPPAGSQLRTPTATHDLPAQLNRTTMHPPSRGIEGTANEASPVTEGLSSFW